MPNIASVLKVEITRVARKEARNEVEPLRKASVQQRGAVAALRRQVEALQKELRQLGRLQRLAAPSSTPTREPKTRRFSAARLAAHRSRLKLSAAAYGKLIGLSGQTVYNWEQGKSRPNSQQLQALADVRGLTDSAIRERLASAAG